MESNQSCGSSQDGARCMFTDTSVPVNELRDKNLLCDAVLRLEDDGVFRVHRVILSMCSAYFWNLFTITDKTDFVLYGVSSNMMIQILDYIYFRKINIHSDNVRQLLMMAEYLCMPGLSELCCNFLKDEINADNCIDIMNFARLHYCADLETHARRFILSHFVEMSEKNKELLELSAEELQAIIGSDKLNMKEERFVWECILRWVNHDQDIRKGYIAALSKGVRLGLIDKYFVLKKVSMPLKSWMFMGSEARIFNSIFTRVLN
ncbi:kelch-like protein 10 [Zootermopsis nevadensis]|uniref:kelch-like protein 10 n=1 Tax=Zootermopsis nevadensis TaxID=136037 RepID=UPI000B8E886A|nr:kelch-like protein 10 [Zootermopsis nevadensis]